MKQGTGHSSDGNRKIEPRATAVAPGRVAAMGIHEIRTRKPDGAGRVYKAPMAGSSSHPCGSQGKH